MRYIFLTACRNEGVELENGLRRFFQWVAYA